MTDTDARDAAGSAGADFDSPGHQARLAELYRDFVAAGMTPLWLTREGLMPPHPRPRAVPYVALGGPAAAGRAQRGACPGRPRRRAPGDQPRQRYTHKLG
jgi:hypothetical protein